MKANDFVHVDGYGLIRRHQAKDRANKMVQRLSSNPTDMNAWELGKAFAEAATKEACVIEKLK